MLPIDTANLPHQTRFLFCFLGDADDGELHAPQPDAVCSGDVHGLLQDVGHHGQYTILRRPCLHKPRLSACLHTRCAARQQARQRRQ